MKAVGAPEPRSSVDRVNPASYAFRMSMLDDPVTFTIPRSAVADVIALSAALTDRMHELLERNTDGALSAIEQGELETLVQMAQFGQVVSMALAAQLTPGKP